MDWQYLLNSPAAMLIGAFLLDLAVGDPRWLPHPVVLMGKVIAARGTAFAEREQRAQRFSRGHDAIALLSYAISRGNLGR